MAVFFSAIAAFLLAFAAAFDSAAAAMRRPTFILAEQQPVTFVFGDSLTDVGNNNFLPYSLAKCNYPWYGIDSSGGRPTGRFTNGRTIGDFISAKLGIPPPPPFLSLSLKDKAILRGVNYASGGAGILNETGLYFIQKLSFDDQIACFEKTKEAITALIGEEDSAKLCKNAVFYIGLGSNDYVNNYLQPFLPDSKSTHSKFLDLVMTTLDGQFRRLYSLGARKIIFNGIGPLGCIPSQRVRSLDGQCLKQVNLYVQQFNSRVEDLMTSLDAELPDSQFAFADSYGIVMDLIENPAANGFKVSRTSCCNVDTSVGGLCMPSSRLCGDRKNFVFWDGYHPTEAANEVIASRIFSDDAKNRLAPVPPPKP